MIKAKKYYGQNFLTDKNVLKQIIQAIPKGTQNIVEIGSGLGDLTQELLKISRVKAYEIDDKLIPYLKKKFQKELECEKLKLFHQDANKIDSFDENKYLLVANLPYYIASRLILKALEDEHCLGLIVMIQKEMALKFCANEGESEFSSLAVLSAMICERKMLFEVEPSCFNPPPKVTSAVISLIKKGEFKDFCELWSFKAFLKDCFKSPRKQLLKNLKLHREKITELLNQFELKENIRPHEICVDLYLEIYKKLKDKYERK
ncbi:16S rRNA (adenine(1518)-N(6)/adenine(1519)-N(6))-dimethyltransferase RsmA [Campylobacter cuniculorum]|uniref:Ribosomal RNA small subunit methyltransferase A n=2 Tax=Campylobacter cuniculorum TaxID=374106 RepID=A0A1W6BZC3_9BACT|nr:16S rRNA (adenine(1518)-N(6)/adenine(1519)-N(6))-dimethyltransferase RsmA [Campylobacter cuniculorum]ARJ57422.1 16S rRNA (adenine1518-N6/adenine1519-N6)-dimethyltransferase [Campylobacter cuniculorum DSM 23162 = LMG 24588]QOR04860.1 16S rRNA (adenine(1518)-N(6)/adenine(1519)-N(6))-dimethyltransferase RsmA [Campylobacter cuniculorum]